MINRPGNIKRSYITTQSAFTITLIVIVLTVLSVWLFGLGQHRTIFINTILSTGLLTLAFFLFIFIGLYKGVKLKDDLGKITDRITWKKIFNPPFNAEWPAEILAEGCGQAIGEAMSSILLWILVGFLALIFLWFFGMAVWAGMIVFIAMLYWIFFRALRLVFKNSSQCKGNLLKSLGFGIGYTVLYYFWIYGIILGIHYLI